MKHYLTSLFNFGITSSNMKKEHSHFQDIEFQFFLENRSEKVWEMSKNSSIPTYSESIGCHSEGGNGPAIAIPRSGVVYTRLMFNVIFIVLYLSFLCM